MEKSLFEQMGGTYTQAGDYLLPNLILAEEQNPIGIWGQRHARYLKQNHKVLYMNLLTSGKLNNYLSDIDKQAEDKERQELLDLHCTATIDGYTDFIFINRFGNPQHQGTLNKAIRRIIRDCNDEQFLKNENPEVLLPHFSCHSLRHTFTTRMCEAGVNVKVIQDTLGHKDISTTLNIYTDVTKELRQSEFECRFVKHLVQ